MHIIFVMPQNISVAKLKQNDSSSCPHEMEIMENII